MLPLLGLLAPLLGKVIGGVTGVVDKLVLDKDKANELKVALTQQVMNQNHSEFETQIKEQTKIVLAEANSQSWLARNWRPGLMVLFGLIIANNYILFPYLNMLLPAKAVLLPVPEQLWSLLTLGIGGYVVGRSTEKAIKLWKGK